MNYFLSQQTQTFPAHKNRPGFTAIELFIAIGIVLFLFGLLTVGIQASRSAASRYTCSNNLRQIGTGFLGFAEQHHGLPRGGEHLISISFDANGNGITPGAGGMINYRCSDLQSPITMVLPFIDGPVDIYDTRYPYNDARAPGNLAIAQSSLQILLCPENSLKSYRYSQNGSFPSLDSLNFAVSDYVAIPYAQNVAGGLTYAPAALTGSAYPVGYYHDFSTGIAGNLPPSDNLASGVNPSTLAKTIGLGRCVQLDTTILGSYNNVGPLTGPANKIDPFFGLPRLTDIKDGSSVTAILFEDVGRNEQMTDVNYDGTTLGNETLDPLASSPGGIFNASTAIRRAHWRWADPGSSSSIRRRVNNTSGGSMIGADPNAMPTDTGNCYNQSWSVHDCGPNNEAFSFHDEGAHMVFADGHVSYVKASISMDILQALLTRNNGLNETGLDYFD